jgi:hypothetical protein
MQSARVLRMCLIAEGIDEQATVSAVVAPASPSLGGVPHLL